MRTYNEDPAHPRKLSFHGLDMQFEVSFSSFDIVDRIAMFGAKDVPHKLKGHEACEETWVKGAQGWKVKASTVTREEILVDGKPPRGGRLRPGPGRPGRGAGRAGP